MWCEGCAPGCQLVLTPAIPPHPHPPPPCWQALRELRLDDNGGLAKACESRLNPLSCLTSLTKLDVRKCEE